MKKTISYKIGVATIFMVSAFVTVLFSTVTLTSVMFFQMSQSMFSDVDMIMTTANSFEGSTNLNRNQYGLNPFEEEGYQAAKAPKPTNATTDLTQSMSGIEIMSTSNIRQRIMESPIADKIEGVSGRWTFFTQLFSKQDKETKIAANYLAIDSK